MPVHARLRQFNTRDTFPKQKRDNDLCQLVVARPAWRVKIDGTVVIADAA